MFPLFEVALTALGLDCAAEVWEQTKNCPLFWSVVQQSTVVGIGKKKLQLEILHIYTY